MRNTLAHIKTLILFSAIAFAGHVLATPEFWFSGTASGALPLQSDNAAWDYTRIGGGEYSVTEGVLEIDLPTNAVIALSPNSYSSADSKRTYVEVDDAVFTPTLVADIDNSVVENSQTALTVAYSDPSTTNYYAYITNSWVKLTNVTPSTSAVDVTVVLDYSSSTYTNVSFRISTPTGSITLEDEDGNYQFPITASERRLGHIELAGYGKLHSITSRVEEVSVSVTPKTVEYGADFTNATVTATVDYSTVSDAEYYLTWNNGDRVKGTVSGDIVTFADVPIDAPSYAYQSASYTITAEVGGSPFLTKNASTEIADVKGWIDENVGTTTTSDAGGSWLPEVSYSGVDATITGEKSFIASNCSTGDLVKITFSNIVYAEFSDLSVATPGGTQGAFALAETNINNQVSTNFCVLAKEGENYIWVAADCSIAATTNVDYTVVMTFDYAIKKYSVKVNGNPLTVSGESQFNLCDTKSSVTDFVFKGSGTLRGIKGEEYTGYMAKDDNHWYVTIQQAITSGNSGPFTILRDTDTTAEFNGWKFDIEDGVTKLKKLAKGLFFMAY